jgi:hypothetical protein
MPSAIAFHRSRRGIRTNRDPFDTIEEYLRAVDQLRRETETEELWFRGVGRSSYPLVPGLYRRETWSYDPDTAMDIFREFSRRAKPFVSNRRLSRWEWYFLMQHYGLPTRLLDWTAAALLALYFAVRDPREMRVPCVWVLEPYSLDLAGGGEGLIYSADPQQMEEQDEEIELRYLTEGHDLPDDPVPVAPPYIDPRVEVQKSVFTIHGRRRYGLENLAQRSDHLELHRLRFRTESARSFRRELYTLGVAEATVFPELDGLARELRWHYALQ